jgi:hypothetical protein
MSYRLLLVNERAILRIENRYTFGLRKSELVLKCGQEEFRASFYVAWNIRVPHTSMNRDWLLSDPRGRVIETNFIAPTIGDKRLILPDFDILRLNLRLHVCATTESIRKFPGKVLFPAKHRLGWSLSEVIPLQISFFDSSLMLGRNVWSYPRPVRRNLGFNTPLHLIELASCNARIDRGGDKCKGRSNRCHPRRPERPSLKLVFSITLDLFVIGYSVRPCLYCDGDGMPYFGMFLFLGLRRVMYGVLYASRLLLKHLSSLERLLLQFSIPCEHTYHYAAKHQNHMISERLKRAPQEACNHAPGGPVR